MSRLRIVLLVPLLIIIRTSVKLTVKDHFYSMQIQYLGNVFINVNLVGTATTIQPIMVAACNSVLLTYGLTTLQSYVPQDAHL